MTKSRIAIAALVATALAVPTALAIGSSVAQAVITSGYTTTNVVITGDSTAETLTIYSCDIIYLCHNPDLPGLPDIRDWNVGGGTDRILAGATTTIDFQGITGADVLTLGTPAAPADLLGGTVVKFEGDSRRNAIVDNTASSTGRHYDVTFFDNTQDATTVVSPGFTFKTPGNAVHALTLNLGSGNDDVLISSSFPNEPIVVNGGAGNDTLTIGGAGTVERLRGNVTFNGGPGTDSMIVDNSAVVAPTTYTIGASITASNSLGNLFAPGADIENITLKTGSANDLLNIDTVGTTSQTFTITDGGGVDDAFINAEQKPVTASASGAVVGTTTFVMPNIENRRYDNPPPGRLVALPPSRILDTRDGTGGRNGKIAGGTSFDLPVLGHNGIPTTGVSAVVMNVTATEGDANGFLTAWPTGAPQPTASNVNFLAGQIIPNLVTVAVGAGGKVSIFAYATTHVVADVAGYYTDSTISLAPGGRLVPLTPSRILDTRPPPDRVGDSAGPVAANGTIDVQVTGRGGVPAAGVSAVVMNVTATGSLGSGFVTVWPQGVDRPNASNLNVVAGQTIANLVVVPVSASGKVSMFTLGGGHLLADVAGYYTDSSAALATAGMLHTVTPNRILDTRPGLQNTGGTVGPVPAKGAINFKVTGVGGVPTDNVAAVILNVTATESIGDGYVTAWPQGVAQPVASNLNVVAGQTIPNLVSVAVSPTGNVSLYTWGGGNLIADVAGWIETV